MMHKCDYAKLIGQSPQWIQDEKTGRLVCSFCHVEPETPAKAAPKAATNVRKTA